LGEGHRAGTSVLAAGRGKTGRVARLKGEISWDEMLGVRTFGEQPECPTRQRGSGLEARRRYRQIQRRRIARTRRATSRKAAELCQDERVLAFRTAKLGRCCVRVSTKSCQDQTRQRERADTHVHELREDRIAGCICEITEREERALESLSCRHWREGCRFSSRE